MRRWVGSVWLGLCILVVGAAPVRAWNKAGHMVTGAVAHQVLEQDKSPTIARVAALLRKHPDYEKYWKKRVEAPDIPEDQRSLYLFMLAARWPDDVRGNEKWYPPDKHWDRWHYINMPFKPEGQPPEVVVSPPEDINILRGYAENLAKLSSANLPDEEKAVALCWICHLVGDVHQPLHTIGLYTSDFQVKENGKVIGDRGGTRFYIRAKPGAKALGLHQFWDDMILGSESFLDARNSATELRNRPELARDKLTELAVTDFEKWALLESFPMAKEHAYRHGKLKGSPTPGGAQPLPEDYYPTVHPIAERRVVLAGYRLAAVLQKALE